MEHFVWVPAIRNYEQEHLHSLAPRTPAEADHPLLPRRMREEQKVSPFKSAPGSSEEVTNQAAEAASEQVEELDPLSAMLLSGGGTSKSQEPAFLDPLANPPPSTPTTRGTTPGRGGGREDGGAEEEEEDEDAKPLWSTRKQAILSSFAITGNVRMRARLLSAQASGEEGEGGGGGGERYRQRLGQLEAGLEEEGAGATREMSQKEYLAHVQRLAGELQRAWGREERVASLKLAIQCAKLLGDVSMPRYYPSMFVHVSDVLDSFGDMVFERLRAMGRGGGGGAQGEGAGRRLSSSGSLSMSGSGSKGSSKLPPLPEDFRAADVCDSAKETCRNWFYKSACIRELLPRLYVELAFVRCYRFLSDGEGPTVLTRLAGIVRGVGDPMVAAYARAYLARQVVRLRLPDVHVRPLLLALLADQLTHLRDFRSHVSYYGPQYLGKRLGGLGDAEYVHLIGPALDWVMRVLARRPCREVFTTVLGHYRELSNSPTVLGLVMETFDPSFYSANSNAMLALIKMVPDITPTQTLHLLSCLGRGLSRHPPPEDQRLPLLNETWRIVTKAGPELLSEYVSCAAAWMGLASAAYGTREMGIMLSDLGRHLDAALSGGVGGVGGGGGMEGLLDTPMAQEGLESIIATVLGQMRRDEAAVASLLTSEATMKVLEGVGSSGRRVEWAKQLLEAFASHRGHRHTQDPVLIHALLDVSRLLHDSLDSLSGEGERRHVSSLLTTFIHTIDMGTDLERALSLYVDFRAAFPNLDLVLDCLVHCVLRLAMRAHAMVMGGSSAKGSRRPTGHSKKSGAFVKACLAYCHITIPSLTDPLRRLCLLLHCGQVSLLNHCLPQTDTFFKSSISLLPDLPPHDECGPIESRLCSQLSHLISALIVVPGHPEHGPLYLIHGLLNAMGRYPGWTVRNGLQIHLRIQVLILLGAYAQRRLPYRLRGVDSNDVLYGGAEGYRSELQTCFHLTLHGTMAQLIALGGAGGGGGPDAPPTPPQGGLSSRGAGGRQAELALELLDALCDLCKLDAHVSGTPEAGATCALLERLLELASPMAGQSRHRATLARLQKRLGPSAMMMGLRQRPGAEGEGLADRMQQATLVAH